MIHYSLLNENIKNLKLHLHQENIDKFNSYIIDKIDDIYFMSEGGLLVIELIDKL